jgi:hypothetical protein
MTSANVIQSTDRSLDIAGPESPVAPNEPIVPVWLKVDDLGVIESCLAQFAATSPSDPALRKHVAVLQKHFAWVRSEFVVKHNASPLGAPPVTT